MTLWCCILCVWDSEYIILVVSYTLAIKREVTRMFFSCRIHESYIALFMLSLGILSRSFTIFISSPPPLHIYNKHLVYGLLYIVRPYVSLKKALV